MTLSEAESIWHGPSPRDRESLPMRQTKGQLSGWVYADKLGHTVFSDRVKM